METVLKACINDRLDTKISEKAKNVFSALVFLIILLASLSSLQAFNSDSIVLNTISIMQGSSKSYQIALNNILLAQTCTLKSNSLDNFHCGQHPFFAKKQNTKRVFINVSA